MVYVDFSNPYLRRYLARHHSARHRQALDDIRGRLGAATSRSLEREREAAEREARPLRPLAAVVDIDEVILCNIHMNSFHDPAGAQGAGAAGFYAADFFLAPDGLPWPREDLRLNPLLPGARELLEALRAAGLHTFFITGRRESIRDETVENFGYVGLAAKGDPGITGALFDLGALAAKNGPLIMCPDAEYPPEGGSIRPFKEARRQAIQETHRIAVNIGDQVSDLGLYGDAHFLVPNCFYWTP